MFIDAPDKTPEARASRVTRLAAEKRIVGCWGWSSQAKEYEQEKEGRGKSSPESDEEEREREKRILCAHYHCLII
jgi:hypothetical protein